MHPLRDVLATPSQIPKTEPPLVAVPALDNAIDAANDMAQSGLRSRAASAKFSGLAELVVLTRPDGAAAERFRTLRSQLPQRAAAWPQRGRILAITSPRRGDGRSWVAANLAVSMAQRGAPTLLVDANLRQPRLHELFGLTAPQGLADVLDGRADFSVVRPVTQVPGLYLLAAGAPPPNPLELLDRPEFGVALGQLATRFAQVLVDTPAAQDCCDAWVVAAQCDSALLVLRRDHTRLAEAKALHALITASGTPLAGVMLNEH